MPLILPSASTSFPSPFRYSISIILVVFMHSCTFKSSAARAALFSRFSSQSCRSVASALFWCRSRHFACSSSTYFRDSIVKGLGLTNNVPDRHYFGSSLRRRVASLNVRGGGGGGRRGDERSLPSPLLKGQRICSFTTEATDDDGALPRLLQRYPVTGCAAIGWRPYMEDEALIQSDVVAVFDGHGGSSVSRYVRQNLYGHIQAILPRVIEDRLKNEEEKEKEQGEQILMEDSSDATTASSTATTNATPVDYKNCLRLALEKMNKEVMRIMHWSYQGSTAVVVWLHETTNCVTDSDTGKKEEHFVRTLVAANIGDSRLILSRNGQAMALSHDHKPDDPIEMAYIESQGGKVTYPSGVPRVNGVMALSRAIGDRSETPAMRATPDLIFEELQWNDDFYVLATDGLWDVMTNNEVVSFLYPCVEEDSSDDAREEMTKNLVLEAFSRGAEDNITVIVVWLR